MRSTNVSCGAGAASRTAAITLSKSCGPVIAETLGNASRIGSGFAPMQPVTITRPFSFIAWPIAAERFLLGAVEKAAGVDDHRVGAGVAARELVALGAQPGENPLAVDERLRAAERDEGDARRGARFGIERCRSRGGDLPRRARRRQGAFPLPCGRGLGGGVPRRKPARAACAVLLSSPSATPSPAGGEGLAGVGN